MKPQPVRWGERVWPSQAAAVRALRAEGLDRVTIRRALALSKERVSTIFARPPRARLTVTLPPRVADRLELLAAERRTTPDRLAGALLATAITETRDA